MASRRDITGQAFGRLTAIHPAPPLNGASRWLFKCECGTEKVVRTYSVTSGVIRSCGCLHNERCKTGLNRRRHGDAGKGRVTRLHNLWRGIIKRCADNFPDPNRVYRARGITVCPEWRDYSTFKAWAIASGYADDLTIDRIDNDKGYSPENCRWATRTEQARNRRTTRLITIDGRSQALAAWLAETDTKSWTFYGRLKRGASERQALGLT